MHSGVHQLRGERTPHRASRSLTEPLSHLVSRVELWPPSCPTSFLEQLQLGNPKGLEAGVQKKTGPLLPTPAPSLDLLQEPEACVSTGDVAQQGAKALWPLPTPSKQESVVILLFSPENSLPERPSLCSLRPPFPPQTSWGAPQPRLQTLL